VKTDKKAWHLAVAGCGTASLPVLRSVLLDTSLPLPETVLTVDVDRVADNAFTCPEYRDQAGRPKAEAAADLVRRWSSRRVPTAAVVSDLEDVDWRVVVRAVPAGQLLAVVAGIDDYDSRLNLVRGLRAANAGRDAELLHVQIGLDRDAAVVSVFSDCWDDPCPACNLPYLPGPEPCLVLDRRGVPSRGSLQAEGRAAAETTVQIIADSLAGRLADWLNRKVVLAFDRDGRPGYRRHVRRRRRMADCLGAHWPSMKLA